MQMGNVDEIKSREGILAKLRSGKTSDSGLPEIPIFSIPGDPIDNFKSKLVSFDGKYVETASREDALKWLAEHVDMSTNVYSALTDFPAPYSPDNITDPHDANILDVSIAEGELGVGETGSIWVTDESLGLAPAALLSTDLILLLDKKRIVDGIQDAYEALDLRSQPYGSFFTGPSATADIEAVHITGAQGEISLTALLY